MKPRLKQMKKRKWPWILLTIMIVAIAAAWQIYDVLDGMTYEGDRARANPSPALLAKEANWRRILKSTRRLELRKRNGVMYCYSSKGVEPRILAREVLEEGYALDTVVGPFFAGSDHDWFISTTDHNERTVDVAAFPEHEFGTTDGTDQEGSGICGSRLVLKIDGQTIIRGVAVTRLRVEWEE